MANKLVVVLVKPWLQCVAMLWGICCSVSRITDYRHFWWDVLAGGSLGVIFSMFTIRVFCKNFRGINEDGGCYNSSIQSSIVPELPGLVVCNGRENKRQQSVRKLLNNSGEVPAESRELGDVTTTWIVTRE